MNLMEPGLNATGGLVFAAGIWVMIDGAVYSHQHDDQLEGLWVTTVVAAVAGLVFNTIPWENLTGGKNGQTALAAKVATIASYTTMLACLVAAIWVGADKGYDWPRQSVSISIALVIVGVSVMRYLPFMCHPKPQSAFMY
eukprot:TRINITY_DN8242_c0_g1_i1.p2 TRINITY_DN8242_c0_g1~~TRINITY_DN8242_c0_g1_i1.p2  ORF type:complete len:140 (+),score=31.50 TRINITY_DN8242_c0_g1_i1:209-628(+)